MIVYISIGNSDDKLSQYEWAQFWSLVESAIHGHAHKIYGSWLSNTNDPWQNACWCIELTTTVGDFGGMALEEHIRRLKAALRSEARAFGQDSIAWAVAPTTEFLGAVDA